MIRDGFIHFHKMVASGNDFIVVDNREKVISDPLLFTKSVCAWHTGIGADGVLLLEKSRRANFKMRIINSDGSEAEACGNGFRCISRYAKEKLNYPSTFRFESLSGVILANIQGRKIRVALPAPKDINVRGEMDVSGNRLHYSYINTGVPHVVILVEGLKDVDVEFLGREIRNHRLFHPRGTNVNFVEVKGKNKISVRTYERGVEKETLACGTGSTGSAIISSLLAGVHSPVQVKTSGGEILTVHFQRVGKKIQKVMLEGESKFVFEGTIARNQISGAS